MELLIVLAGVLAVLFAAAFITNRRLGVLGFALAAGSVLSSLWAETVTPWLRDFGLEIVAPPMTLLVAVVILLLPAILLLFSGPSYAKKTGRIIGASLFALLACAFLVDPLGANIILTPESQGVYDFIVANHEYIITLGLLASLFDLLATKTRKPPKDDAKH